MNEKNVLDILNEDIVIPEVVQERADAAFAQIRSDACNESFRMDVGAAGKRGQRRLHRIGHRRAMVAGLAAVLILGTVTAGAAAYLRWSDGLEKGLRVTPEQKDMAESSGLADFPELSVTDEGVTVTAEQSIVDNYFAYLSFRVEGYEVPEGLQPEFDQVSVKVGGGAVSYVNSFYNGLIVGEDGKAQRADGAEIPLDENGAMILDYSMEDGSLEYRITLYPDGEKGRFMDKTIQVAFSGLGVYSDEEGGAEELQVEIPGNWAFDWTMKGDGNTYTAQCNEAVGDSGAVLTGVEISPISVKVDLAFPRQEITETGFRESQEMVDGELKQVSEPFEYTTYVEPPMLMGVKLKDGTLLTRLTGPGLGGYVDEESDQHEQLFATNRILDVDQVQSLLFLKEAPEGEGGLLTEENLYVVDIR